MSYHFTLISPLSLTLYSFIRYPANSSFLGAVAPNSRQTLAGVLRSFSPHSLTLYSRNGLLLHYMILTPLVRKAIHFGFIRYPANSSFLGAVAPNSRQTLAGVSRSFHLIHLRFTPAMVYNIIYCRSMEVIGVLGVLVCYTFFIM